MSDIRGFFKLGRTAAYELTHRPEFPKPVVISPRCYRWWASEVGEYASNLSREGVRRRNRPTPRTYSSHPGTAQRRIIGTVRTARTRKEAR
ncbi:MAG: helix-turn-helix transcriptional regulator [Streptosporangiaceae bacterium]